ncbi:dihydroxy-acid dehydratase, partial [Methylobacterium tarhaniae]|uniref:dihydroxy-acid dehydratase domain-containing protein n=1 Tax=Methylobacterium tarhaniae TaxID=1187852 RepID=UPI003D0577A0
MGKGLRKGLTSYGDAGFSLFLRKAFIKAAGYSDDALDRPIVGITNTASDYNPCHGNAAQLIEAAKRGVMLAGAMPMVFPTISIHESFAHPTSMYLRLSVLGTALGAADQALGVGGHRQGEGESSSGQEG